MTVFIPFNSGGSLSQAIVAGVIGAGNVDAFAVSDNNKVTGQFLRDLIGETFEPHKKLEDMNAVSASATAMNAVSASATAMNAVSASATARTAIGTSGQAFDVIKASNMAIGKYVAGLAGLDPSAYADMNAVSASATAMNAVSASATAMNAVSASATAMNAVVKSITACTAIYSSIQSYRNILINTLNAAINFTKTTFTIGDGSGIFDNNLNSNTIYIPIACYDDNDTDYTAYHGFDISKSFVSVAKHAGNVAVSSGVGLKGVRLVGTGGTVGNMAFDIYTAT